MNIAILGAGAWGTALSVSLAASHQVTLWARNGLLAAEIGSSRRNSRYLPEVPIPASIAITDTLAGALAESDAVLIATPSSQLRDVLARVRASGPARPVLWACKGFEQGSNKLPHQVAADVIGKDAACGALSGPSFALEVAQGRPTALTLASRDAEFAKRMALGLHQPSLRVYSSSDLTGVEISGAVKNVMAIACGISDGLELGLNARAALITRGLAELTRLGVALGGRSETFMGLAGVGDLILTCTGELSRNRRVGQRLALGDPLDTILKQLGHVAEGVYSAPAVEALAEEKKIDMPITKAVCSVLFRGLAPREAAQQLLARDPKTED
jgi:glycerol-3-phosphate dehydrogenase (NAD(P)+)